MKDKIKMVFNGGYFIFEGPTAYEDLALFREIFDDRKWNYLVFTKRRFFGWKKMHTINDLTLSE